MSAGPRLCSCVGVVWLVNALNLLLITGLVTKAMILLFLSRWKPKNADAARPAFNFVVVFSRVPYEALRNVIRHTVNLINIWSCKNKIIATWQDKFVFVDWQFFRRDSPKKKDNPWLVGGWWHEQNCKEDWLKTKNPGWKKNEKRDYVREAQSSADILEHPFFGSSALIRQSFTTFHSLVFSSKSSRRLTTDILAECLLVALTLSSLKCVLCLLVMWTLASKFVIKLDFYVRNENRWPVLQANPSPQPKIT